MQITFQLETHELNKNLLDAIKKAFTGKRISIVVTETEENQDEILEAKIQKGLNSTTRYVFEDGDFAAFTNQLMVNEPVNIASYKKTLIP